MGMTTERAKRVRGPKDLGGRRRTAGFQARNAKLANALFFFFLSYLPPLQLGNDLYGFFSPKTFLSFCNVSFGFRRWARI